MGCLILSGGRDDDDPPYPRPAAEAEPREEPYALRSSLRPADSPALPAPDSADERGAIGENLCQPPLLLPLS